MSIRLSTRYILKVHKDVRLVNYEPRLKVMRNLTELIYKNRLAHLSLNEATKAAKAISKSPIVTDVTVTRVEESAPLIFRNGEQYKS